MSNKILLSIAGLRFDRGMGEYTKVLLPYLADYYGQNLIVVTNTHNIPHNVRSSFEREKKIPFLTYKLPLPIFEQAFIPILIKRFNVNIAYFPGNTFPIIKPEGVKYVVTIHDLMFFSKEKQKTFKQKLGKIYRKIVVEKGIDNIDFITTPSLKVLRDIYNFLRKDNLRLIHSSLDFDKIQISKSNDILIRHNLAPKNYCYTVTGVSYNKNFPFLLKAFSKLSEMYPELKLVISGLSKEQAISAYGDLFRSLKINRERLIFTGYITHEDMMLLMKLSLAFLMLSKDEGFGRPIIEALWAGALVVASDIPVFREIGKDFVEYVDIKDEYCLVKFFKENYHKASHKLIFKKEEINRYLLSNFDAKKVSLELINVFESLDNHG